MKLWKAMVRTGLVGLLLVVAAPSPRAHATVQFSLAPVPMGSGGTFSIDFLVTPFTFGVASSTSTPADIQITGGQYRGPTNALLDDFSTTLPAVTSVVDDLNWNGNTLTPTFRFEFFDNTREFTIDSSLVACNQTVPSTFCANTLGVDRDIDSITALSYVPSAAGAPEPPGWVLLAAGASLVGWICQQRARRKATPPAPAIAERTC